MGSNWMHLISWFQKGWKRGSGELLQTSQFLSLGRYRANNLGKNFEIKTKGWWRVVMDLWRRTFKMWRWIWVCSRYSVASVDLSELNNWMWTVEVWLCMPVVGSHRFCHWLSWINFYHLIGYFWSCCKAWCKYCLVLHEALPQFRGRWQNSGT